jgi:uncharacterized damage-inducible protein DinB
MLTSEWLAASARYNRWMNDKIYTAAAGLTDEARKRDVGAFFRSIHGTLNHLMVADRVWLGRFRGLPVADGDMAPGIRSLDQELYADFEELRRQRSALDDELTSWVGGVTEEQLAGPLVYRRFGAQLECTLRWAVAQVFNHQTHHRGQVTALLTQQGCDPGATDLFAMLKEEQLRG